MKFFQQADYNYTNTLDLSIETNYLFSFCHIKDRDLVERRICELLAYVIISQITGFVDKISARLTD